MLLLTNLEFLEYLNQFFFTLCSTLIQLGRRKVAEDGQIC